MKVTLTKTKAGQYILHNVRIAYPAAYKPKAFKGEGALRYGVTALVPKEATNVVDQLTAEINKIAKDKFKLVKLPSADCCFRDGDEKTNAAMHGNFVLQAYAYPNEDAKRGGAPQVVDMSQIEIKEGASNAPVSGCYANILFDLYTPNSWKKVSAGLKCIQFVAPGEFIGNETDLSEMPLEEASVATGDDSGFE